MRGAMTVPLSPSISRGEAFLLPAAAKERFAWSWRSWRARHIAAAILCTLCLSILSLLIFCLQSTQAVLGLCFCLFTENHQGASFSI